MNIEKPPADAYTDLNRLAKGLVRELVKGYEHLARPGTPFRERHPADYRSSVNVLFRSPDLVHTGDRHLQVGRLETLAVVQTELTDPSDLHSGMILRNNGGYDIRMVFGQRLLLMPGFSDYLEGGLASHASHMDHCLRKAEYREFIELYLTLVNGSLQESKKVLNQGGK